MLRVNHKCCLSIKSKAGLDGFRSASCVGMSMKR